MNYKVKNILSQHVQTGTAAVFVPRMSDVIALSWSWLLFVLLL
jgi:hypothetical protein